MRVLAVIPARTGSKRVKNKNIKILGGKPLITYTILTALKSKYVTDICLSTDSIKIKQIGLDNGLLIPFLRSKKLSNSTALTIDVVKDAIKKFESYHETKYDYILLLQPTCPFREDNLIDKCIKILKNNSSLDSLITVSDVNSYHPYRMKFMDENNILKNVIEQGFEDMRPIQKIKKAYIRSGSIYLCKKETINKYNSLVGKHTYGVELKNEYTINIDTPEDFQMARKFLKK